MRRVISVFVSCALLIGAQTSAQAQALNGDEFATSHKYCDKKWQELMAENAAGGQSREKFDRRCVCDHRWQEKVAANIDDKQKRERDRLRCLGYYAGNDAPEYAFFGGATLILSLIGLTSSGGGSFGRPVSP